MAWTADMEILDKQTMEDVFDVMPEVHQEIFDTFMETAPGKLDLLKAAM